MKFFVLWETFLLRDLNFHLVVEAEWSKAIMFISPCKEWIINNLETVLCCSMSY